MTHLAAVKFDDTALEVGTGSGYQAAVLAPLVRKVCAVEIIPSLAEAAAKVLRGLGYDNVSVKVGDGYQGWSECSPFDAIIVTAALEHVPPPLIEQLKVGGRLVMPLGLPRRGSSSLLSKRSHRVRRGCARLSSYTSCPLPGPRIECYNTGDNDRRLEPLPGTLLCRNLAFVVTLMEWSSWRSIIRTPTSLPSSYSRPSPNTSGRRSQSGPRRP